MATLEEIKVGVQSLASTLTVIDGTLDDVKAKIDSLVAGQVSQEQIDELGALVASAKSHATAVSAEATSLVAEPEVPAQETPAPSDDQPAS